MIAAMSDRITPDRHRIASTLSRAAQLIVDEILQEPIDIKEAESVQIELAGVRITVSVSPALPAASAAASALPPNTDDLREVELSAIEAAPAFDAEPVSAKKLAALAGYKPSSYFRSAVQSCVDRGLLVRTSRGIRKTEQPGA